MYYRNRSNIEYIREYLPVYTLVAVYRLEASRNGDNSHHLHKMSQVFLFCLQDDSRVLMYSLLKNYTWLGKNDSHLNRFKSNGLRIEELFCWYTGVGYSTSLGWLSPIPAETWIGSTFVFIFLTSHFALYNKAIKCYEERATKKNSNNRVSPLFTNVPSSINQYSIESTSRRSWVVASKFLENE